MATIIIGAIGILFIIFIAKYNNRNTVVKKFTQPKSDNLETFKVEWVVDRTEKRERTRAGIRRKIPYILPILIYGAIAEYAKINSFKLPLIFVLVVLFGFFLFYIGTYLFPYRKRQYVMDNSNIYVARGNKNKSYKWEDFEYFFGDPDRKSYKDKNYRNKEKREKYVKDIAEIEGETFFIKLKPASIFSRLIKNVLVIHTEPDNHDKVREILSEKLTERNGLNVSFIHYQFK